MAPKDMGGYDSHFIHRLIAAEFEPIIDWTYFIRSRPWGRDKSSHGPTGTMRVGLISS